MNNSAREREFEAAIARHDAYLQRVSVMLTCLAANKQYPAGIEFSEDELRQFDAQLDELNRSQGIAESSWRPPGHLAYELGGTWSSDSPAGEATWLKNYEGALNRSKTYFVTARGRIRKPLR